MQILHFVTQLSSAQEALVNLSRLAERATPPLPPPPPTAPTYAEPQAPPPRGTEGKPPPQQQQPPGVNNRLSTKLYGDLQQRVKQLELVYLRQENVPICTYGDTRLVLLTSLMGRKWFHAFV